MQKLNQQATKIFFRLLENLKGHDYIKFGAEGFMPLSLERIQENILTPWGIGTLYSLSHYYEQNGDLMRDPEMCFIVVTVTGGVHTEVDIYPQLFRQDNMNIYEESIRIENNTVTTYIKTWQSGHAGFANMWLKNISKQGFLK